MRHMLDQLHLVEDEDMSQKRRDTWAGQASWAIGPYRCDECVFFKRRGDRGSCRKARQAIGNPIRMDNFPPDALSCRYFDARPPKKPKERKLNADDKIIDLKLVKYHETPNAYLLGPAGDPDLKTWLPKSLVQDNNDGTWTMPEWKAIEKGLENYLADR